MVLAFGERCEKVVPEKFQIPRFQIQDPKAGEVWFTGVRCEGYKDECRKCRCWVGIIMLWVCSGGLKCVAWQLKGNGDERFSSYMLGKRSDVEALLNNE
jgi:hypothetical protein